MPVGASGCRLRRRLGAGRGARSPGPPPGFGHSRTHSRVPMPFRLCRLSGQEGVRSRLYAASSPRTTASNVSWQRLLAQPLNQSVNCPARHVRNARQQRLSFVRRNAGNVSKSLQGASRTADCARPEIVPLHQEAAFNDTLRKLKRGRLREVRIPPGLDGAGRRIGFIRKNDIPILSY